jgi:DNA mismatch endonuclease (patch repair protein)
VFVDGDFWHGRRWTLRRAKLAAGANGAYWVEKIEGNISRDRRQRSKLRRAGWTVKRYWESDVFIRSAEIADEIASIARSSLSRRRA